MDCRGYGKEYWVETLIQGVRMSVAIYFFPIIEGNVRQRKHWKRNVRKNGKKMLCSRFKPCQKKTIKKLDEEISAKNMTLKFNDALIESRKTDVAEWDEKSGVFQVGISEG